MICSYLYLLSDISLCDHMVKLYYEFMENVLKKEK